MNLCAQCRSPLPGTTNVCAACGFVNPIAKKGTSTFLIVLVVMFAVGIPALGVFAVLGVFGVRKYIANAKTAEARNTLGQLAKDVVVAYEGGNAGSLNAPRRLCPSATAPVPANERMVSGRKYQSMPSEWHADKVTNAGFACLKFEMMSPQYFQYRYQSTGTGFIVTARGDLNGDGKFSTFAITGILVGDRLVVGPKIIETDPEE